MININVDQTRCSGCGRCISACELRLFSFETRNWKKTSVLSDSELCSGCGKCAQLCVTGAIVLECGDMVTCARD
ncbi:MAG: 4Fe-4S binding protein, partial [Burkholderiales bacterium]|nr:4Fe-4S binding protein [Burkholderiales bacterium]